MKRILACAALLGAGGAVCGPACGGIAVIDGQGGAAQCTGESENSTFAAISGVVVATGSIGTGPGSCALDCHGCECTCRELWCCMNQPGNCPVVAMTKQCNFMPQCVATCATKPLFEQVVDSFACKTTVDVLTHQSADFKTICKG